MTATAPPRQHLLDWRGVAGMRDFLAHHYFATRPDVIQLTLDKRLPLPEAAIDRLRELPTTPPE